MAQAGEIFLLVAGKKLFFAAVADFIVEASAVNANSVLEERKASNK
jgi:hypothetical protein